SDGARDRGETWALTLEPTTEWTKLPVDATAPPADLGSCAVYDSLRDRVVLFGGQDAIHDQVWVLELSGTPGWSAPHWRPLAPTGSVPARAGAAAVWDPRRDRVIVFGGAGTDGSCANDLHTLS